jgi:hypothetical protein
MQAIARILRPTKDGFGTVGAGCLVSARHILACAHVVAGALGLSASDPTPPDAELTLDLPFVDGEPRFSARIPFLVPVAEKPIIGEPEDIAVLEVLDPDPLAVVPARIVALDPKAVADREVRVCGFPDHVDRGEWLRGWLRGMVGGGLVQLDAELGSRTIRAGFSGAPVIGKIENAVIGMIVSTQSVEGTTVRYMIPVNTVIRAWPPLKKLLSFRPKDATDPSGPAKALPNAENLIAPPFAQRMRWKHAEQASRDRGFWVWWRKWLAATVFARRNTTRYLDNLVAEHRAFTFLGRAKPLELENIYVSLKVGEHTPRALRPDGSNAPPSEEPDVLVVAGPVVEADEALSLSRRLVVLGDPGSGKTTLLKYLVLQLAQRDVRLEAFAQALIPTRATRLLEPLCRFLSGANAAVPGLVSALAALMAWLVQAFRYDMTLTALLVWLLFLIALFLLLIKLSRGATVFGAVFALGLVGYAAWEPHLVGPVAVGLMGISVGLAFIPSGYSGHSRCCEPCSGALLATRFLSI